MNNEIKEYCENQGLLYLRDNDSIIQPFDEPPIVVNYFYHEEITKTAKRKTDAISYSKSHSETLHISQSKIIFDFQNHCR